MLQTLRDIGYTISDPRKLRAFEEEERDLVQEARRFVLAVILSVAAIPNNLRQRDLDAASAKLAAESGLPHRQSPKASMLPAFTGGVSRCLPGASP